MSSSPSRESRERLTRFPKKEEHVAKAQRSDRKLRTWNNKGIHHGWDIRMHRLNN